MTFDRLTLELVCNVTRGIHDLRANFGAYATFLCGVMQTRVKRTT